MTERRTTTDPAAEHDTTVSNTYREIAIERTPEHLDRAVLDVAKHEVRPGYSRLRAWTRPAAWAAVVMLSVTLILQTGQVPVHDAGVTTSKDAALESDRAQLQEMDDVEAAAAPDADVAERKAEAPARKSEILPAAAATDDPRELRAADEAIAEPAGVTDRMRQGREAAPEPTFYEMLPSAPHESANRSASFVVSEEESRPTCDDDARTDPERWLNCIRELEDAGFVDAAEAELEELEAAFPNFVTR